MKKPLAIFIACLAFAASGAGANDVQSPPEDKPLPVREEENDAALIAHLELLEMLELLESLDTIEAQPEATP